MGGVDDRKVVMTEMVEQRALYTRAKRREGANPDLAELNPNRQRTGTFSTKEIGQMACSTLEHCDYS
jgi:hypothetical protein